MFALEVNISIMVVVREKGQREGTDEFTEHFARQVLSLLAKCCLWPAFFVAYYLLAKSRERGMLFLPYG